jgi:hypothetical protein
MNIKVFFIFAPLLVLLSLQGYAQTAAHPGAEKALEQIVLEQDFGDDLKFHSREAATFADNPRVPGLNGLMFMRWKGANPATEIVASLQWFEETIDLLPFYRAERARTARGLLSIGNTVIWKTGEQSYLWTDGEHFVVGLGGSPAPPQEMMEAWLALIESNLPDLVQIPTASP